MVRELHGTKDLFDCDHAIFITSGDILDNAAQVAKN